MNEFKKATIKSEVQITIDAVRLNSFYYILKSKYPKRNEGEKWKQPSGRLVTKKNGEIIPVQSKTKRIFKHLPSNFKASKLKIITFVNNILIGKIPENQYFPIRKIQSQTADKIKDLTGIDVSDFAHSLDLSSVRKVFKSHGNKETELKRGQIPIIPEDFTKIPEIVDEFDSIRLKSSEGKNVVVIEYKKEIGDCYYYLEQIRTGTGTLIPMTMYKRKSKGETNL